MSLTVVQIPLPFRRSSTLQNQLRAFEYVRSSIRNAIFLLHIVAIFTRSLLFLHAWGERLVFIISESKDLNDLYMVTSHTWNPQCGDETSLLSPDPNSPARVHNLSR